MTFFKNFLIFFTLTFSFSAFAQEATINENEIIPLEYMSKLKPMLGKWDTEHFEFKDHAWVKTATSETHFKERLKGKLITEEFHSVEPADAFTVETYISYDQYRNVYRVAAVDDIYGLMDIYEGQLGPKGKLVVTNFRAGTNFPMENGGTMHFRLTFTEINKDHREFLVELTSDEGKNWAPMFKNTLRRLK